MRITCFSYWHMCNTCSQLDVQCSSFKCAHGASLQKGDCKRICTTLSRAVTSFCLSFSLSAHDDSSTRLFGQRLDCFVRCIELHKCTRLNQTAEIACTRFAHREERSIAHQSRLHYSRPDMHTKMRRCTKIQVQMHSGCTQGRLQQVREHGIAHHKMHRDSVALLLLSSNREQESIDPCL